MPITIDRDIARPALSPVCGNCVHLTSVLRHRCAAFPDGIPDVIWDGTNEHTQPFAGDRGLRFQKRTGPLPEKILR